MEDSAKYIAEKISEGKVVSLFQGRNEWRPRALGNRTILSSASDAKRLDNINLRIKERELGRPLGPGILEEDKNVLLGNIKSIGRYMNIAYEAPKCIEMFPAIIHVDDTFRPEFVKKEFNETYYKQLSAIKKM